MSETKTTKAYKVSTEVKEKLESLFTESGLETQEAFIEHIATLYEMQRMKDGGAAGYKKQLDELEYHSRRSVELFLGMIETETSERFQLTQNHEASLISKSEVIFAQEQEISDMRKESKTQAEEITRLTKELDAQSKQAEQLSEISRKDNLLVEEYRQRIDTLSGLVNEYKDDAAENSTLKTKITELTSLTDRQAVRIAELENAAAASELAHTERLHQQDERHRDTLERVTERKDVEKEREMLALRTEYQAKIERVNEETTTRLREVYVQMDKLREEIAATKRKDDE